MRRESGASESLAGKFLGVLPVSAPLPPTAHLRHEASGDAESLAESSHVLHLEPAVPRAPIVRNRHDLPGGSSCSSVWDVDLPLPGRKRSWRLRCVDGGVSAITVVTQTMSEQFGILEYPDKCKARMWTTVQTCPGKQ